MEIGQILIHAAACTTFAKAIVDVLKKSAIPTPSWSLPILALGIGVFVAFLLTIALGEEVTLQIAALDILAGFMAGAGAVGVTELGRSAYRQVLEEEKKE